MLFLSCEWDVTKIKPQISQGIESSFLENLAYFGLQSIIYKIAVYIFGTEEAKASCFTIYHMKFLRKK